MKTRTVFGLATLAAAALLAHADAQQATSYEGVIKEMLGQLTNIHKALVGITDEDSARAAEPDLEKAAKKLAELRKLADTLPQPDKDEKDRLELAYRSKFDETLKKLRSETIRVKAIPGGEEAVKKIAVATKKKVP